MKKLFSLPAALGVGLLTLPAWGSSHGGEIPDPVEHWNHLWNEVLIDLFILGFIFFVLMVWWVIKYKAKNEDQVGEGPTLSRAQAWSWAMLPAFLFMADDFFLAAKGWTVWNVYRDVPENALEVKVTANMWFFEFEYENGAYSSYDVDSQDGDGLVVPAGTPVVLRMTSSDVLHSFGLVEYRVKEDIMPGRVTYIWFYPKEARETFVTCVEYCGTNHSRMYAPVKVVPQGEYDAWMAATLQGA